MTPECTTIVEKTVAIAALFHSSALSAFSLEVMAPLKLLTKERA